MLGIIILLFISLFPVFLIGWFIYSKDKNKEPKKLLIKLFLFGILACFLTFFITFILSLFFPVLLEENIDLDYVGLFFYVFFSIALVEEFSKWLMVYLVSYKNKAFDEVYDMIVYSVFVALGFAAFENILYVFQGGLSTAILRAITAIPGHTCYGVLMGYYLLGSKIDLLNNNTELAKKKMIYSILVPTIIHGIYDYSLLAGNIYLLGIFIVFLIFIYIITFKKIREVLKINVGLYQNNFCSNCGNSIKNYKYCINCGNKVN